MGRDSARLLPGASELGRRAWPPLIKQKLQAEREKGRGLRVWGPHWLEPMFCPPVSHCWA